jgi:hypothetical protein
MGNSVKHFLLIILSVLLLSSPVIGDNHKGETLYGWGKCCDFIWKGFGDKETHPVYKGDVKNGVPNGLGIFTDTWGGKYVGSWKDGKMNGQGTWTLSSGGKYEGEYKDWKQHGQGTEFYSYGRKWEGEWKDGRRWNGIYYDKDGNITEIWVNGELQ